jgi:hypothetical protein
MSKRAFSRSFDMPTIDPDKEDESTEGVRVIKYKGDPPEFIPSSQGQEYIDKIVGELTRNIENSLGIKCPVVAKSGCDHSWTSYTGLSESFEFCKHCDEKR